jgi:murein DD-endopeptidase MepM/ murein hydrolase activator NlpD
VPHPQPAHGLATVVAVALLPLALLWLGLRAAPAQPADTHGVSQSGNAQTVSHPVLVQSAAPAATASGALTLLIPVEGVRADQLTDTFDDARAAGRRHDAIDIMAPKGTRVLAAADGTVVKLFTSVRGGLTVYQFDPDRTVEYYYAHLDRYAPGLAEGATLKRGDPVGFVGSSGDADPAAPHLHFEIAVLGPEKHWWQATDINPYPVLTGRQTLADALRNAGAKPREIPEQVQSSRR